MSESKVQNIFDACDDHAEFSQRFILRWSEKGRGFGEYAFYWDEEKKKMICDNECDSKEDVKRMLSIMVDQCEFVD